MMTLRYSIRRSRNSVSIRRVVCCIMYKYALTRHSEHRTAEELFFFFIVGDICNKALIFFNLYNTMCFIHSSRGI